MAHRKSSYIPAVPFFLNNNNNNDSINKKDKKVLVVGAGCAGLGTGWHLNRVGIDVTVYESDSRIGGHANTINGYN